MIIDLQGAYLPQLHHPTVLAQSSVDPAHVVPLLFDTGLRHSSCMFDKDHRPQYTQFTGGNQGAINICLAPVGGANPLAIGTTLPSPAPVFARVASLPVNSIGHVCAISHRYLLGAVGQPRLVAFWNTAPAIQRTPITLPAEELTFLRGVFNQPALSAYAVPISFVDPTNAAVAIPHAANQTVLTVTIELSGLFTSCLVPDPNGHGAGITIQANVDTGAALTVITSALAGFLQLNDQDEARVVIPRLDFPNSNPALTLLNVPAVVDRGYGLDHLTIGSTLFDRFTQIVFDLDLPQPQIRLLP